MFLLPCLLIGALTETSFLAWGGVAVVLTWLCEWWWSGSPNPMEWPLWDGSDE